MHRRMHVTCADVLRWGRAHARSHAHACDATFGRPLLTGHMSAAASGPVGASRHSCPAPRRRKARFRGSHGAHIRWSMEHGVWSLCSAIRSAASAAWPLPRCRAHTATHATQVHIDGLSRIPPRANHRASRAQRHRAAAQPRSLAASVVLATSCLAGRAWPSFSNGQQRMHLVPPKLKLQEQRVGHRGVLDCRGHGKPRQAKVRGDVVICMPGDDRLASGSVGPTPRRDPPRRVPRACQLPAHRVVCQAAARRAAPAATSRAISGGPRD